MSSFQRMIAIPQEEYLAITAMQNVTHPSAQHFYNLENKYKTDENIRDPYRRLVMQSNTLDEMKQVKDNIRNSLTVATPKPYQNRAQALFKSLESHLRFNDKGEIYSDDGNIISGSRVEDLINYAVRDRRRNIVPKGWSQFVNILRDLNVPKTILNRDTLDTLEGKSSPTTTSTSALTPPSIRTPKRKRKLPPLTDSLKKRNHLSDSIKKRKSLRIQKPRVTKTDAETFLKYYK